MMFELMAAWRNGWIGAEAVVHEPGTGEVEIRSDERNAEKQRIREPTDPALEMRHRRARLNKINYWFVYGIGSFRVWIINCVGCELDWGIKIFWWQINDKPFAETAIEDVEISYIIHVNYTHIMSASVQSMSIIYIIHVNYIHIMSTTIHVNHIHIISTTYIYIHREINWKSK